MAGDVSNEDATVVAAAVPGRRISLPVLAMIVAAFVAGLYGGVLLLGRGGAVQEDRPVAAAAAGQGEPTTPPAAESSPSPVQDTYDVGRYTFSNVQVVNDGLGDFSIRADVRNNGEPCAGVLFTASIFETGTVVGTVTGQAQAFGTGDTQPITLSGLSDFTTSWDQIAFQIDAEF